jgi:hypothetical protein
LYICGALPFLKMKKYLSVFILAFFLPVCSQNVFAGLKVLEGEHTVVYDIVNPRGVAFIPEYSNESFDQKVVNLDEYSKRVTVTSKMGPLKTRVPFPVPTQRLVCGCITLPTAGAGPPVSGSCHCAPVRGDHPGKQVCPCRIVDSEGQEIYVGQVVTGTNAVEQGVAGYARDVKAAANNFRVTDNPAVIKGLRASGSAGTDIVVARADARMLHQLGGQGDFLQNCRVIIVY